MNRKTPTRVFVSAREDDGGEWDRNVFEPPQFDTDQAQAMWPRMKQVRHAIATLYTAGAGHRVSAPIRMGLHEPQTGAAGVSIKEMDHGALLVPKRFAGHDIGKGIELHNRHDRGVDGYWLPMQGESWSQEGLRALEQRGLRLLVKHGQSHSGKLVRVDIGEAPQEDFAGEQTTVWLNPLVMVLHGDTPLPKREDMTSRETPIEEEIRNARKRETYVIAAALSIEAERRAAGWEVIWHRRIRKNKSLLDDLFERRPQGTETPVEDHGTDLATLDMLGGAFIAEKTRNGTLAWGWKAHDEDMPEAQLELATHLQSELGLRKARGTQGELLIWGEGRRNTTPQRIEAEIEWPMTAAGMLDALSRGAQKIEGQELLGEVLREFSEIAARMENTHASNIFAPLVSRRRAGETRWSDDANRLTETIAASYCTPRSEVCIPLSLARPEQGVDTNRCFGTNDMTGHFDAFRSPQTPVSLLETVTWHESTDVPAHSKVRGAWYAALWKHCAAGKKNARFRLVDKSSVFKLDVSRLNEAILGDRGTP